MLTKAVSYRTQTRKAKTPRTTIALLSMVCLLVAFPLAVYAQSEAAGATIEGTARDASGAVLPGVAIEIKNSETGFTRSLVTNDVGRYTASLLPVGIYEVTAQLSGFVTVKV